jgi:hypothetical protein
MLNYIPSFDEYLNEASEDRRTPEQKTSDSIAALKMSSAKIQKSIKEHPEKIGLFKVQLELINAKINVINIQTKLRKTQKAYAK